MPTLHESHDGCSIMRYILGPTVHDAMGTLLWARASKAPHIVSKWKPICFNPSFKMTSDTLWVKRSAPWLGSLPTGGTPIPHGSMTPYTQSCFALR